MKRQNLKIKMIKILVICWLVPIALASFVVFILLNGRMSEQVSRTVAASANKAVANVSMQLEDCVNASRNATYFSVLEESYNTYRQTHEEQKLYDSLMLYLSQQYRYNRRINTTMVFFMEDPDLFYSTYSYGTTYDRILFFKSRYLSRVKDLSGKIDTSTYLFGDRDALYMARNLMDDSFNIYGMIVFELNTAYLFDNLATTWGYAESGIFVDGEWVYGECDKLPGAVVFDQPVKNATIVRSEGRNYVYYTDTFGGQMVTYLIGLDKSILFANINATYLVLAIVLLALIPLCISVFVFLQRMVSDPVERLVEASKEISEGHYGYHIPAPKKEGSLEFKYLNDSFNGMSDELKHQFEQIYVEELAIRDANIKALQSQINPHFLNNTLEIINWEARLNGVYKVSSMIEALSTMLNSTLNRRNVQKIPLSEELEYVDAYLYIISERMGDRLKYIREVDESLLRCEVPGLIIQPIIENAVEHGIKLAGGITVSLKIYTEGDYIYIDVRNTGHMSKADEEKIAALLGDSETTDNHSLSIGIRNVNKRLKLMYGEECGLTIVNDGEDTLSRLKAGRGEN